MASRILPRRWFAENKGCVLPSVKHPTCREYAVAHLKQQEEYDYKLELKKKDKENEQLKEKVKDLEEALIRTQEENLRLVSELQKCQGLHGENDQQLERQAVDLQKQRNEYEEKLHLAGEGIQKMDVALSTLESSYIKIVKMAVDRELALDDYRKEISAKDLEVLKMEFELSTIKEQRREHEEELKRAEDKIRHLQDTLKSWEESYANMVKMAVDRELQLDDYEKKMAAKEREVLQLKFESAKQKEQRAVKNFQFQGEHRGSPSEVGT